jgi:lysozyme
MINKAALDLIKEFEGFRAEAYLDPVGIPTIGYGTTAAAGVGIVPRLGMTITEKDAAGYLEVTVEKFGRQVEAMLTRPASANQFGAMVSLAYNIGPGAFARSSVLRLFNAGDEAAAADAFLLWNKGTVNGKKVVLKGLARRREAERALFLRPEVVDPTLPNGDPRSDWWAALMAFITNLLGRRT